MPKMKHRFIIALLPMIFLIGCVNKKKAIQYVRNSPEVSAKICTELYPIKEIFIPGKEIIKIDTLSEIDTFLLKQDTAIINDTVFVSIYIPEIKTITKTMIRTDTIVKRDSAGYKNLQNKIHEMARRHTATLEKTIKQQRRITTLTRILWIVGLIGAIFGISKFTKFKI